jgi:hypothetical protein
MKRFLLAYILAGVCLNAAVIKSFDGTASPSTQGWSSNSGILSGSAVTDLGESSWQMTGNNCCGYWQAPLTSAQLTDALTRGWSLSALVRDVTTAGFGYIDFIPNGGTRFDINFGFDGVNQWAGLSNFFDAGNPALKVIIANTSYHLLDMRYSPATQKASLWLDGVEVLSNYAGTTNSSRTMARFLAWWGPRHPCSAKSRSRSTIRCQLCLSLAPGC